MLNIGVRLISGGAPSAWFIHLVGVQSLAPLACNQLVRVGTSVLTAFFLIMHALMDAYSIHRSSQPAPMLCAGVFQTSWCMPPVTREMALYAMPTSPMPRGRLTMVL